MIDTFLPQGTTKPIKCIEYLAKHAPSTKKEIYVADTSCGRVQGELWRIAMSFLIEVKRLREEVKDYDACLQNLWDNELIPDDTDIWDEVKELLEVD